MEMAIWAEAIRAMEGERIAPETRDRILGILHDYETGLLKETDCTGCVWLSGFGCQNPKDCQRDVLVDRYQVKGECYEDGKRGTGDGTGITDVGGKA